MLQSKFALKIKLFGATIVGLCLSAVAPPYFPFRSSAALLVIENSLSSMLLYFLIIYLDKGAAGLSSFELVDFYFSTLHSFIELSISDFLEYSYFF